MKMVTPEERSVVLDLSRLDTCPSDEADGPQPDEIPPGRTITAPCTPVVPGSVHQPHGPLPRDDVLALRQHVPKGILCGDGYPAAHPHEVCREILRLSVAP